MKVKLLTCILVLALIGLIDIPNVSSVEVLPTPTKLASLDSDKDGYSDLCEYLHKTDLNDAESKPSSNITINVPSDIKTIQEAINVSIDGDIILVAQGKYRGNINFKGRTITLTSTLNQSKLDSGQADPQNSDVIANTIIEGTENGSVITIDSNSIIKGFTITSPVRNKFLYGASKNIDCRGIYVKNSSPKIENCTIIDNETTELGGGIYIAKKSKPKIKNSIITGNADSTGSQGISSQIYGGKPQISQSWINSHGLVDNTIETNNTNEEPTEQSIVSVTETIVIEPTSADTELASAEPPTTEDLSDTTIDNSEDSSDTTINNTENLEEDSPIILLSGSPVWYVDDDASDTGTGTSWTDAFKYLQDALNDTRILTGDEIRVAQGTYKPDQGDTPLDRTAAFQLINGVTLKGGYAGIGAPDSDARDVATYKTILSGDLIGNDGPNFANYSDNSCHVVTGADNAILDGFIIEKGNADPTGIPVSEPVWEPGMPFSPPPPPNDSGAGIFCFGTSPTINNCTIRNNYAVWGGGGMYNSSCSPTINNCTFYENYAQYGGGAGNFWRATNTTFTNCTFRDNEVMHAGGGMVNSSCGLIVLSNCNFIANTARMGGGISNGGQGDLTITNCAFSANLANDSGGGAISTVSGDVIATNCVFNANASTGGVGADGGAIYFGIYGSMSLVNCTFKGNSAEKNGNALRNGKGNLVNITNCIFWDNGNEIYNSQSTPTVTYSDIWGGYTGIGNINSDPLFVNASNPAGTDGIFATLDDGLRIRINSPCIDIANDSKAPATDITDQGRIDIPDIGFAIADIGACESGHDFDSDGMPDEWESFYGLDPYDQYDADNDPDSDGLINLDEYLNNTAPNDSDTDDDELNDGDEVNVYNTDPLDSDTDNDEMPDGWEVQYSLNPLDPSDATQDPDEDSVTNLQEYQQGTDPQNPNPVLVWEKTGLLSPVDVVVDNNRNVYVLESGASRVTIYDKDGNYLTPVILGASNPMGIDLDDTGNLYIADTGNNRIMKMDVVDTERFTFSLDTTFNGDGIAGEYGTGDSQLDQPWGIGVDSEGNVYVTDSGNNRIQKLDSTGEFVDRWGTLGADDGQFYQPKGIFVDAIGNIQIADSGNNRIQEFTSSGSLLNVWESTNLFYQPADLALNNYYIYVTDAGNNQVQKFDNYNEYITSLTNLGLNNPQGIAIDENLYQELIYIADTGNSRLLKAEIPIIPPDETWNDTKEALGTGNIELALENFDEASKERYSQIFTAIEAQLPTIISNMQAIELIYIRGDIAKYRIKREEGGQDITYYIYFNKDENGKWKIRNF